MDTKRQLICTLVGLGSTITEAMDQIEGFVPCSHPALVVTGALNALTDGASEEALAEQIETVRGFIDHVSENRGVTAYNNIELAEPAGTKAELFAEIGGIAQLTKTAGVKNTEANEWLYRSLAALSGDNAAAKAKLAEAAGIKSQLQQRS